MKYTKSLLYFLLLCFISITMSAQNTIPATGGNVSGSGGSVSYSVGQVIYGTISGTNGAIVQGVQQPFEILVMTTIRNSEDINLKYLIYPNPTGGIIKLVFESPDFENLRIRLFDINGVLLQDKKIESRETEISLENLSSSVYFLRVINKNKGVKVFKIVKK